MVIKGYSPINATSTLLVQLVFALGNKIAGCLKLKKDDRVLVSSAFWCPYSARNVVLLTIKIKRRITHLILDCPAYEPVRRAIFGTTSSNFVLWSRPWGVVRLLGLHGVFSCSHPSEGLCTDLLTKLPVMKIDYIKLCWRNRNLRLIIMIKYTYKLYSFSLTSYFASWYSGSNYQTTTDSQSC